MAKKSKISKPKYSKVKKLSVKKKDLFGKKPAPKKRVKKRLTKVGKDFQKSVDVISPNTLAKQVTRTMILKDVYTKTPDRYKKRAKHAIVTSFKARADYSGGGREDEVTGRRIVLAETYTTHDAKGNPKTKAELHYQFIIGYSTNLNKRLWTNPSKVSCSCKDFLFTDEVALHKRGNADVYFSNGADPVIKNPKFKPQTCKHLIAVMRQVRSRRL